MQKLEHIGLQLFSVRDFLKTEEDAKVTFEKLKKMGYDEGQTAGCNFPVEAYARLAREAGIAIVGTHEKIDFLEGDPVAAMKHHDVLGTKNMGVGGCFVKTMEDWETMIECIRNVIKAIAPHGYKFTYHHHSNEFIRYENGKTPMELLLEVMDPRYSSFVLDTHWLQHAGLDARHYIEKMAGRVDILHLKDGAFVHDGGHVITEVGNGNLWWEGIIESAQKSGVKHYCVEQDNNFIDNDPFKSLKVASDYLHANFM